MSISEGIVGFVAKELFNGLQSYQLAAERRRIAGLSARKAFRQGDAALGKGQFPLALMLFERAAFELPRAANLAGLMHRDGLGTQVDLGTADAWFTHAAAAGDQEAKQHLAELRAAQEPPPKPEERFASAAECCKAAMVAAEAGDLVRSFLLFSQAAQGGDRLAMNNLGYAYGTGNGTELDYVQAVHWYGRSAEHGYSIGQHNYAVFLCAGLGCTENKAEAARWMKRAAEQDYAAGQRELGRYYLEGTGVARNLDEARRWLEKAGAQGDTKAKELLAQLPPEPKPEPRPEPPKAPPKPARGTTAWATAELGLTEGQAGNRIFVNAAWRAAMDIHHPDKPGGSTQKAQAINEARDLLLKHIEAKA